MLLFEFFHVDHYCWCLRLIAFATSTYPAHIHTPLPPTTTKKQHPHCSLHHSLTDSKIHEPSVKSSQSTNAPSLPSPASPPTPASSSTKPVPKPNPTVSRAKTLPPSNTSLGTLHVLNRSILRGAGSVLLVSPLCWLDFRRREVRCCIRRIRRGLIVSGRLR